MRRRVDDAGTLPVRLTRFEPDEWPDAADVFEAFAAWSAARDVWAAERGLMDGVEDGADIAAAATLPDAPWDQDAI